MLAWFGLDILASAYYMGVTRDERLAVYCRNHSSGEYRCFFLNLFTCVLAYVSF